MSSSSSTKIPNSSKPYREEHLEDAQVQKFKKEFDEWKEFKSCEFSCNLVFNSRDHFKSEQVLVTQNDNDKEMTGDARNFLSQKKAIERDGYCYLNKLKITQNQLHSFPQIESYPQQFLPEVDDDGSLKQTLNIKFQEKMNTPSLPARIVILKPSYDVKVVMKDACGSSPESELVKKGGNTEDLLEEVKERLKYEMEGKGRNDSLITSSLHKNSIESKCQLPREMKLGSILGRSESMRSYRNPFHFDEYDSSNFIKEETRKYIFDRLKHVLKDEDGGQSVSFWEANKAVNESIPKVKRVPPSTLIRSFSAFASFGDPPSEVQTEDPNLLSKNNSSVVKKDKKDGFSIKSTVLKLRKNLGMKGNYFGKKVSLMGESSTTRYVKSSEIMPSFAPNFGILQDNSTEVPPSPASYSCSPIREHLSPVSPLEAPFSEDLSSAQVSGELIMIAQEFERRAEHLENKNSLITTETHLYDGNETIFIEDCGETYIRDILTASGLYGPACWPLDYAISMLDGHMKPIPSWIFDNAGDKHRKLWNVNDYYESKLSLGNIDINRKVLFDLANEALPAVLKLKKLTHSLAQLPHGRKLLDELTNQIKIYANSSYDDNPESILKMMPWLNASIENLCFIGRALEWLIMSEVIDDLLFDLLY